MSNSLARTRIGDGVHFNRISDPKFKHNRLSVSFITPLSRAGASDNAAAPLILRMGCRLLPDFSSLNARLGELYGASLDAIVSKFGGYQVLEVSIRGLDNRYALENEDITEECAGLLAQIVLDPKLDAGGFFDSKDTALQRRYVQDTIEAEINDKRAYALSQCLQAMCEGEPAAVRAYGYPETAAAITPESAAKAYRNMLRGAPVEIFFTGSGDAGGAEKIFAEAFAGLSREPGGYPLVKLHPRAETVREKTETMELSQSKLVLGMRCGELETPEKLNAARLFSAMFGGTPFSKLFLNVREKLSLCYYCASRFDPATRLLMVDSGVEAENKQKAHSEIMAQLAAIAAGDFTGDELRDTKLLMKNSVLTTADSLSATEGWYMSQILRGQAVSPAQDAADIGRVTREEVMEAAKGVTLDTVYFLKGEGEEEAEAR